VADRKQEHFLCVSLNGANEVDVFVCPVCGFEAGTIQTAGKLQCAIAKAYREKVGLPSNN